MKCFQCDKKISTSCKSLQCNGCLNTFHLDCISNIKEADYQFLISSNLPWKCLTCEKTVKNVERPVTPIREKQITLEETQSPKNCQLCLKGFSFNAHRGSCKMCKAVFHFKCLGTTKDDFLAKHGKNLTFVCEDCKLKLDPSQRVTANPSEGDKIIAAGQVHAPTGDKSPSGDVTLSILLAEMRSFRTEVANTQRDLTENMAKHSDWVEELKIKLDGVAKQVADFTVEMSAIKQENVNLKKQVSDLTKKVNNMEQNSKENVLEIHGIPSNKEENLIQLVNKVSTSIGFDFDEKMIDNCYRYGSRNATNNPGGIVVKFVRKIDAELFVQKRKEKRNLNTRDLGFMDGQSNPVYVNCSLTQWKRQLLNSARKAKTEKQYTFLWVRNGRIYMRKNQGDRYVVIEGEEDIARLA